MTSKKKVGRKSTIDKWLSENGLETLCKWAKLGLNNKELAEKMQIGKSTFYDWCNRNPELLDAIKKARTIPALELENTMYDTATGNVWVEEVKTIIDPTTQQVTRIERVKRQQPPNATIQIFLAKNWLPNKYRDKQENYNHNEIVQIVDDIPKQGEKSRADEFK